MNFETLLPLNLSGFDAYVDTETAGLYGDIRLLQVYLTPRGETDGKLYIIDTHDEDYGINGGLYSALDSLKTADKIIGHNLLYDFHCLKPYGYLPKDFHRWEDTFLLARLAKPEWEKYSLDACMEKVWGFDPYEKAGLEKKKLQRTKWGEVELDENHLLYAALDVMFLPRVFHAVKDAVGSFSYRLDKLTAEYFVECRGALPLDIEKVKERHTHNTALLKRWNLPINANSYRQVRPWLGIEESDDAALAALACGCGDSPTYKINECAVKAENFDELEKQIENGYMMTEEDWAAMPVSYRAATVRKIRAIRKQNSFLEDYEKRLTPDGYVEGHLGLSPISGRSSCAEANLQQIPSALKDVFASKDKYLIYADFSNLELRTFAAVVGDDTMAKLLIDGTDLHRYTAAFLFNIPEEEVTDTQRSIAKVFNFSSLYGAGAKKKQSILLKWTGINLSDEEVYMYHIRWYQLYPKVWQWHQESAKRMDTGELTVTPLGRRVKADRLNMWLNIPIQGAGAEIAKLALHYMSETTDIGKLLMYVHDSYTFEACTEEEAKRVAEAVGDAMGEAWVQYMPACKIKNIPMPVEVDVVPPGVDWKSLQKGKDRIYRYETVGHYIEKEVICS